MIKEISNPSPTIYEYVQKKRVLRRISKTSHGISVADANVNDDPLLVSEFAERSGISEDFARQLIVAFFEEIKKQMFDGNVVNIYGFGKFFINGPKRNENKQLIVPSKFANLFPKFKANIALKKLLRNNTDSNI